VSREVCGRLRPRFDWRYWQSRLSSRHRLQAGSFASHFKCLYRQWVQASRATGLCLALPGDEALSRLCSDPSTRGVNIIVAQEQSSWTSQEGWKRMQALPALANRKQRSICRYLLVTSCDAFSWPRYWRMAGAVSPAALSQIRSSVSQSWITVSQAVCRIIRAILKIY